MNCDVQISSVNKNLNKMYGNWGLWQLWITVVNDEGGLIAKNDGKFMILSLSLTLRI